MNRTAEIVIKSIKAQICGTTENIGEISAEEFTPLYAFALAQDVAHIVAAELKIQGLLKNGISMCDMFYKQLLMSAMRYEAMNAELIKVCNAFEQEEIAHMPLKGSVMRQYYPEPWMRTSGDIDILVHIEDIDRALDIITNNLNYKNTGKTPHDLELLSPNGVHLDLHFDTVEESYSGNASEVLMNIWDYAVLKEDTKYLYVLSDGMFYFYHVAHMAKHFEETGCGIRFFLDMWLLNNSEKFNAHEAEDLIHKGGLTKFENGARSLAEAWFSGAEYSSTAKSMENYVLNGGVYGGWENTVAATQAEKFGRIKYLFSLFFPPYERMVRQYTILEKHKYLMPFLYIHKWFSMIFSGKTKSSIETLRNSSKVLHDKTDGVRELFGELGLKN